MTEHTRTDAPFQSSGKRKRSTARLLKVSSCALVLALIINVIASWILAVVYGAVPMVDHSIYFGTEYLEDSSVSIGALEEQLIRQSYYVSQHKKTRAEYEAWLKLVSFEIPSFDSIECEFPYWTVAAGVLATHEPLKLQSGESGTIIVDRAFGFPLASMRYRIRGIYDPPDAVILTKYEILGGLRLPYDPEGWQNFPAALPLVPIALPFLINSLIYFVLISGVWGFYAHRS